MEYEESSDVEMMPIEEIDKPRNPSRTDMQVKFIMINIIINYKCNNK